MGYCMKLFLVKSLILRLNNYLHFFLLPVFFPLVLSVIIHHVQANLYYGALRRVHSQPHMPLRVAKKAVFLESALRCCLFHQMGVVVQ